MYDILVMHVAYSIAHLAYVTHNIGLRQFVVLVGNLIKQFSTRQTKPHSKNTIYTMGIL